MMLFFCQRRDLLLLHMETLVATKEIMLTHTLIFDNTLITLSATYIVTIIAMVISHDVMRKN